MTQTYEHYSHTHCWAQKQPSACGIQLEKHVQCCLCSLAYPKKEPTEEGLVEEFEEKMRRVIDYSIACGEGKMRPEDVPMIDMPAFFRASLARERSKLLEEARGCVPEKKGAADIIQLMVCDQSTPDGKLHYQREYGKQEGYNACREATLKALTHLEEKV